MKFAALLILCCSCATGPAHDMITNIHYEPDHGCGGGYVMTICQVREDWQPDRCWTGDVRDWRGWAK